MGISIKGICVNKGITYGSLYYYKKKDKPIIKMLVEDATSELKRLERAVNLVKLELTGICDKARYELGPQSALIFEAHLQLLDDPEYIDVIISKIMKQSINAEYAIKETSEYLADIFRGIKDDYIKSRINDIEYISDRLIALLSNSDTEYNSSEGCSKDIYKTKVIEIDKDKVIDKYEDRYESKSVDKYEDKPDDEPVDKPVNNLEDILEDKSLDLIDNEPVGVYEHDYNSARDPKMVIIVADDLTPGEFMTLNSENILGLILNRTSIYSHTGILAASSNIPTITGIDLAAYEGLNDRYAIIDGDRGMVYIDPSPDEIKQSNLRIERKKEEEAQLLMLKGKDSVTQYGRRVAIYSNVGSIKEVEYARQQDAEGIGLFRSEYLYLNREQPPTEEEQFNVYSQAAIAMDGKKVILRTLDIGADKKVSYLDLIKEDNPALGYRAIRFCLDRKDIFITQLKAMLRASVYGDVAIMLPMIVSVDEVRNAKALIDEAKDELSRDHVPYKNVPLGIMIETPAAVIISDMLAKEVEFFSIGTNDLIQYTLAADRQNPKLLGIYNSRHPAILRMIKLVVKNAHANGVSVGICGEMAADLSFTETFVAMGIDTFSVAPRHILPLRRKVRETSK